MAKKKQGRRRLNQKQLLEKFKKSPMNVEAMRRNYEAKALFTGKRVYKKEAAFIAH